MLERVELQIAGKTFAVMERYEEGHEITAGEASALNQTLRENIRNNLSKKENLTQEEVDQYAQTYAFGVRSASGGRSSDPVMTEYMALARKKIKELLKKANKKADADAINAAAKGMLQKPAGQELWALAQSRVAQASAIASDTLADLIGEIPEKQPEATPAPASAA